MNSTENKKEGLSLRRVYIWIIVGAVILSGLMIYSTLHMSSTFHRLSDATNEYIELEKAAYELMDASDYLTEEVQRFTVDADLKHLDNYFEEAFESNRREEAVAKMANDPKSEAALKELEEALNESKALMETEYYAMKLVIEAKGYTDYPDALNDIELKPVDAALAANAKMRLATEKVLNNAYYAQKDKIRNNMQESLNELEKLTKSEEEITEADMVGEMTFVRIIIIVMVLGIIATIWLTSRLGISPVLRAVDKIKDDSPIPEVGANEFRYLARTYNKMYSVYKKSVEKLNYKASHDELTGVYNRSGYELLLSSVDLGTTYMIMFDVDDFKYINDGYGHEMGDKMLQKVANTLKENFRSDDYVCRIGGDEFVVFMVHADEKRKLIAGKIERINGELEKAEEGLVATSISAGIAHGSRAKNPQELFNQADQAMYQSKQNGKHTYTFYEP